MIRDAVLALALKIIGTALWLGYAVILARLLSQDEFGLVFYVVNFVLLVAPIASFGFGNTILRFGATYWQAQELGLFRALLMQGRRSALLGSILVCTGLVVAAALNLDNPLINNIEVTVLTSIAVILFTLMGIHRDALRAAQRLLTGLMGTTIIRSLVPIIGSVLLAIVGELSAMRALALFIVGLALSVALEFYWISKLNLSAQVTISSNLPEQRRVARHIWMADTGNAILVRADVFIVGIVLDLKAVALYLAAQRLASLSTFMLDAVRTAIAPEISRNYRQEPKNLDYQNTIARGSALFALMGLLGGAGIIILGWPLLALFGPTYTNAFYALLFLTLGQLSWAIFGPTALVMTMSNMQRERSIMTGIAAIGVVVFTWVAATFGGITEVAITVAIFWWLNNAALALLIWKRQRILTGIINPVSHAYFQPTNIMAAMRTLFKKC